MPANNSSEFEIDLQMVETAHKKPVFSYEIRSWRFSGEVLQIGWKAKGDGRR